jgi:G3E family GTPase
LLPPGNFAGSFFAVTIPQRVMAANARAISAHGLRQGANQELLRKPPPRRERALWSADAAARPRRPIVIHGVQHIFHPPLKLDAWPGEDRRTRIVFITRNIDKETIEETLGVFERRGPKRHQH